MTLPDGPRAPRVVQLARWIARPAETLDACAARYGDCFTMHLPSNPPFVLFSHPEAVREIFTADADELRAGVANAVLEPAVGPGSLLLLDGARHLRERRLMMPPFHGDRMRAYGETMRDTAARAIAAWSTSEPVGLHHQMQVITLDVILKTVFGLESGAQMDRVRELLVRYTSTGTSVLGTTLLFGFRPSIARKLESLGVEPLRLGPFRLDLTRVVPWRDLAQAGREVNQMLYAELAARRAAPAADRQDVLSLLMSARDEAGQPMTDSELRDEMLTLLLAGHETSATTLAWALQHLLSHAEVLSQVQAELRSVGTSGPYLDAVLKETMRLTPIVPMVVRRLERARSIGGHALPAGVNVAACLYLTHRRPELWPDPLRFDPTRFLGHKTDPYAYFPFGGGTRRCLGMAFASYEMKVVLGEVLTRARLRLADPRPVHVVRRGVAFAPSGGVQARVN